MKVKHFVSIYPQIGFGEELICEFEIDDFRLLQSIFQFYLIEDPNLYKPYKIGKIEFELLKNVLKELLNYEFDCHEFYLEAYSI